MNDSLEQVADACAHAFRNYMLKPDEAALRDAYEIGRTALADGIGVLEMAHVCSRALAAVVTSPPVELEPPWPASAERFFAEALSPFEMAHRGFKEANVVLRRLNQQLEDQTRRIASLLHDEAAQLLTPMHLKLSDLSTRVAPEAAADIETVRSLMLDLEERLRTISHELRPLILDHVGLAPALELLCESISKRWGVAVDVLVLPGQVLPPSVETALYRTVQEALTNVARHAHASCVVVSLQKSPKSIACTISDDGIGYDWKAGQPSLEGLGLTGIRERAVAFGGGMEIGPSREGHGTTLTLRIPLEE